MKHKIPHIDDRTVRPVRSYEINKIVTLPTNPFVREPVELKLLEWTERLLAAQLKERFKLSYCTVRLSHIDKKELPASQGFRRFSIQNAYITKGPEL